MRQKFPDYDNCIVNLANSILNEFSLPEEGRQGLKGFASYLAKNYENIVAITDYPKIMECLARMPSIEPRALNLFVREEKKAQFEEEFQKEFGEKFLLWTKEEVLSRKIFGTGDEHPDFREMLGDLL